MATIPSDQSGWARHFSPATRTQLLNDDTEAFSSVATIITVIVIGGLLLGLTGVILALSSG
ncbi:MAG: hypothetical protein ACI9G1_005716 [Pirellulaceae bacterium]|jgi:hypothetical protein